MSDLAALQATADALRAEVELALTLGEIPPRAREAYAAELAVADAHLAAGRPVKAAAAFDRAIALATHRVLHFDSDRSPLAEDPTGWTAPLAESTTAARIRVPRGRSRRRVRAFDKLRNRGPQRLLICTWRNATFLGPIREHFADRPGVTTTFQEFGDVPELKDGTGRIARAVLSDGALPHAAEDAFRPWLDGADVVLVDWCNALPALLTLVDPRDTRIVLRLHSFEVFTKWPHLLDWGRVDDVVFVSEHLRRLALAAIPGLREAGTRTHVIANAMDLQRFPRPKPAEARFVVGLVGASTRVKDPRWAIEVLRELRRHDDRYTLQLNGHPFARDDSAATKRYAEALDRDLAELGPAVVDGGFADDVPAALEQVGVVLSSSLRESFHLGVAEGAASGAVPVVRDWPFFPGGAAELFGDDWVVTSPAQAAERILAVTADEDIWRAAGAEASRRVIDRYDWSHVGPAYDELLLGRSRA